MSDGMTYCPRPKLEGVPQSTNSLCWLAGYTTLFLWGGMRDKNKIQKHIEGKLSAAGIDLGDARRSGLKRKDNKTAGMALGLQVRGYGQPITVHNLRQCLYKSPVWASGQWFKNSNHIYVIVGVSEKTTEYYDSWYDSWPHEAMEKRTVSTKWILHGNGKDLKGLAHTFQSYPLHFFG